MEVWDYRRNVIEHHGVKGQKWGERRYQNYDGTLTSFGKQHYKTSGIASTGSSVANTVMKPTKLLRNTRSSVGSGIAGSAVQNGVKPRPTSLFRKEMHEERSRSKLPAYMRNDDNSLNDWSRALNIPIYKFNSDGLSDPGLIGGGVYAGNEGVKTALEREKMKELIEERQKHIIDLQKEAFKRAAETSNVTAKKKNILNKMEAALSSIIRKIKKEVF